MKLFDIMMILGKCCGNYRAISRNFQETTLKKKLQKQGNSR